MQFEMVSKEGSPQGNIELNDYVFNTNISEGSVYHGIRNELANKRQGTAKTKGRAEVAYSGRKPWKQKGTGRARAGTRRSPIWVGGGTIFGPQPRDYSYTLPKKMKRLAFRSVLTDKIKENVVMVVEDFKIESKKTKDCVAVLSKLNADKVRSVLIVGNTEDDVNIKIAGRNIPWVRIYSYSRMLLKDLFYAKKIILTKSAAEQLNVFYGEKSTGGTLGDETKGGE